MLRNHSVGRIVCVTGLACLLTLLTACASVSWECKVGGKVNEKQKSGDATIAAEVSGTVFAGTGSAAMAGALGIKDTLDAGSITMDTSGSSVAWPQTGTVALTIRSKSSNVVLAAQSFPWGRSGSVISFSNPAAVDSWLSSSGADAATHKVDYAFQNLVVPAEEGNNLIAVDIYRGNVAEATAAATIPYRERDECPPRTPNCHVP
jgi:hypothetical protein